MSSFRRGDIDVVASAMAHEYYVLLHGECLGPYRTEELHRIVGFTLQTPVRSSSETDWKPAFTVLDLGAYFGNTKPADWEETASRILAQKRRENRKVRWQKAMRYIGRAFKRLIFLSLCVTAAGAGFYALRFSHFDVRRWEAPLEAKTHQGLQWAIGTLQNLDSKYFPAPVLVPAAMPVPAPTQISITPPPVPLVVKHPIHKTPKPARHTRRNHTH